MTPLGRTEQSEETMAVYKMKKCPTCIGAGVCSDGDPCPSCEGTGEIPSDEAIIDDPCQPVMEAPRKG